MKTKLVRFFIVINALWLIPCAPYGIGKLTIYTNGNTFTIGETWFLGAISIIGVLIVTAIITVIVVLTILWIKDGE
jgi:hypothetical protein